MKLTVNSRQLTAKWEMKKLGDLSKINYGYTAKASFDEVGLKFLRITDIQNDSVNWDNVPYCAIDESNIQKYQLLDNDIVFARTGATPGKSYLIKDPPPSVAASYLIRLRLNNSNASPEFIAKYFQISDFTIRMRIREKNIYNPYVASFVKSKLLRQQIIKSGNEISISSLNQNGCIEKLSSLSLPQKILNYQEEQSY